MIDTGDKKDEGVDGIAMWQDRAVNIHGKDQFDGLNDNARMLMKSINIQLDLGKQVSMEDI